MGKKIGKTSVRTLKYTGIGKYFDRILLGEPPSGFFGRLLSVRRPRHALGAASDNVDGSDISV